MRINKWLAERIGVSRRKADWMVEDGQVSLNNRKAKLGDQVNEGDEVRVRGNMVSNKVSGEHKYYLVNKTPDMVTTTRDDRGRRTIMSVLPADLRSGVKPVGRLDINTTGVVLMTNDGDLAYRLTHPKFGVEKKYWLWLKGVIPNEGIKALKKGVKLHDGYAKPKEITKVRENERETILEVTMTEGRKREVRRMVEATGWQLSHLKRVEFAGLKLESIPEVGWRELSINEIEILKKRDCSKT